MSVEDGAAQKREIPKKKGGGGVMTADGKERKVVVVKGCPAHGGLWMQRGSWYVGPCNW